MGDRTSKMCYSRYRRIENQNKKLWNQEEDTKIKEGIQLWGFDWERISELFPSILFIYAQKKHPNKFKSTTIITLGLTLTRILGPTRKTFSLCNSYANTERTGSSLRANSSAEHTTKSKIDITAVSKEQRTRNCRRKTEQRKRVYDS